MLHLAVLGDSLAAGYGLGRPKAEAYPALVQAACDGRGWPVRVANHGVSGSTSADGLARLDAVLDAPVDVLVVALGANDALRGVPPGVLRANLAEIVRRARAHHADVRPVLCGLTLPPIAGNHLAFAHYRSAADAYVRAFAAASKETGAAFVPSLLAGVAGVRALNQPDGVHPTAEGQRRIAANLWAVLEAVVRDRLAAPARS